MRIWLQQYISHLALTNEISAAHFTAAIANVSTDTDLFESLVHTAYRYLVSTFTILYRFIYILTV